MATSKIKGITIQIGADTTKFSKSLRGVDSALKSTQSQLKAVNNALKIDPKNTDLLKQKQELLNKAYEQTAKRLDELKKARDKALDPSVVQANVKKVTDEISKQEEKIKSATEAMKGVEKGSEEYKKLEATIEKANARIEEEKDKLKAINDNGQVKALNAEIAETEAKLKQAKNAADDFGSVLNQKMKAIGSDITDFGNKVSNIGEGLTKSLTVPIVAAGGVVLKTFTEVDDSLDIIVKKTGLTGDALEELQDIAKDLATTMPVSFEDASIAVGEINTRFGLVGDDLEELSKEFLRFSEVNDTDLNSSIDKTQKIMEAFGLTSKDVGAYLDALTVAGQKSGASLDSIQDELLANQSVLDSLNFSLSDSISLFADLELSGANTSDVLTGLKKAFQNASKNGQDLSNVIGTALTSMESSIELFGNKSGPALYNAFQRGVIGIEDFQAKNSDLQDTLGATERTFEALQDPTDNFTQILNQLKLLLSDIGADVGPVLLEIAQIAGPILKDASEAWNGLDEDTKKLIVQLLLLAASLGPIIVGVGKFIAVIGSVVSTLGPVVSAIGGLITGGIELGAIFGTIATAVSTAAGVIGSAIAGIGALLAGISAPVWGIIAIIAVVVTLILTHLDEVKAAFSVAIDFVSDIWNGFIEKLTGWIDTIKELFTAENIKEAWNLLWSGLRDEATQKGEEILNNITSVVSGISNIITNSINNLKTTITNGWNNIKNFIKTTIDSIKNFMNFDWSLPKIKLPHFKVSGSANPVDWLKNGVPKISVDWYRKAGGGVPYLFNQPSIVGIGDVPEVVVGADLFNSLVGAGTGETTINISINNPSVRSDSDIDLLSERVAQKIQSNINRINASRR